MNNYIEREYFDLDTVYKYYEPTSVIGLGNDTSTTLKTFIEDVIDETIPTGSNLLDTKCNTLFCNYIYPTFKYEWVVYNDNEEDLDDDIFKPWMYHFIAKLLETFDKYSRLIDIYDANKANLMNGVTSGNTVRFNDTPQNGGTFTSDSYTSTFTRTDYETSGGTPMERMDEINKRLPNLYRAWMYEFKGMFGDNYE